MDKFKKITAYVLSILLTVLVSALFLLVVLNVTILNKNNVRKQLHQVDYAYRISDIIVDSTKDYILQSGFDESILNKDFIRQESQTDISNVIDVIFDGAELKVSTDEIEKKLDENIESFVTENDYVVSDETQKGIDQFKDSIKQKYEKNVVYDAQTVKEISKYAVKAKKDIWIAIAIVAAIGLAIGFIIFKLYRPAISTAFLATGIMFTAVKFFSEINIAISNVLVLNRPFSDFVIRLFRQVTQYVMISGFIFITVGLILAIFFETQSKRYRGE